MEPLDWWKVKPSSSPPLSWAEVLALPAGIVVMEVLSTDDSALPLLVLEGTGRERRARARELRSWSKEITLQDVPKHQLRVSIRLPKLPRLSFAMTKDAVRKRQKTVTRRLALPSWWKEGAWFLGVDRIRLAGAQGLCIGRCGPANREPLVAISQDDVNREGFPHTTPEGFISMFRSTTPREWDGWVWRLPFSYLEIPE